MGSHPWVLCHTKHTQHPLPIQFGLNPLRNASFQSLTLRNRRQNLLVYTLTSASGAGTGVCPVPKGSGSKRQLLMDGWESHGQLRALKHPLHCPVPPMQGQTARHHNWIPNPCHSTNSATSKDSASTTQESDKQGKPGRATSDNPNITLMPSVIKLIPKLAFEPCTDNEHSESWKTASLWSGRNVHRGEKEEMFYKFTQSLIISTVIQQLCPSWIDVIMHTKYKNI